MSKVGYAALALAIGLVGCGSPQTDAPQTDTMATFDPVAPPTQAADGVGARAVATLQTSDGNPAGSATVSAGATGLLLSVRVEGLPPGERGAHVHMVGTCEAPGFTSAGDHWNPDSREHGLENPQGQHAGDMPNLTVGSDGRGTLEYTLKGGTFDQLLDSDGSAMVIHAGADDQRTNPSGNSGDRIACGVFQAG